jgi:imidazolonepropionase
LSTSLLITGASQLLTVRGTGPRRGASLSELEIVEGGALLVRDGRIVAVGTRTVVEALVEAKRAEKLDVGGRVVLPGLVDAHTHLIHAASRAEEYELKIRGASYEEIARKGGGILNSVEKLRAATADELKARAHKALKEFAAHGTTTLEAKSGYGLDAASELKTLLLYQELEREQPIEIVRTFLGAHVLPAEYRRAGQAERYVDLLTDKMIPEVARAGLASYCDVFCDRGAFTLSQTKRVLRAGLACRLTPRVHAEQLSRTGATVAAVRMGAASCDHLEYASSLDIRVLAKSNTVAGLLPGCDFHLGLRRYAPARALIDAGAIVSLATDFNPGTSPTMSMPMILSLACAQLRMTPAEALAAATINAAYSLGRAEEIGSLEVGKQADLAAFEVEDYREIPYYFGVNTCWMTMKRGTVIHSRSEQIASLKVRAISAEENR